MKSYDLIILGGGAAAFAAAIKASELGARAAMINYNLPLGGTCVNIGCVPSKNLLHAGEIYYYGSRGVKGIEIKRHLSFKEVINHKNEVVKRLRQKKYTSVAKSLKGVEVFKGRASFISENKVAAGNKVLRGRKFVIATGASPNIIPIGGIEKVDYLTNVEALELKRLPESMVVIGGRALALEFAQMYAHFGTKVTILQRSDRIIPEEEEIVSDMLRRYLEAEGIKIYTSVAVKSVREDGKYKIVSAHVNGKSMEFKGEELLLATGRKPNTSQLGLEKAGVKLGRNGEVIVSEDMRTSAEHIYAAGDVTGEPMLETVAAKEGAIAAENALTGSGKKMDFLAVPHAIFTSPQVASVGLTERRAEERGIRCRCTAIAMEHVPKAQVVGDARGVIKMVIEDSTERILGVHILAPLAAEMIHEAVLAVKYKLTIYDIINIVYVFPTFSEAIKLVAQSFRRDISKMSCCVE